MSLPVVIAQRAEQDMSLQYEWYAKHADLEVAERYLKSVDRTIHRLAEQPDLGLIRHFKSSELQGIRSSQVHGSFDRHLIFYRVTDVLSIERIIHGARDLPRRLIEEPGAV
ncbi:toxin ParE1/3/4 [Prosthecobacter fusiformis]|uniref:Toxin ParE1/3/4 n=1 Tax=Prosthecobacter fusiformis TaxID=48464 RepID=A0A4R7S0M3_9BACT|nr:type II toxin-antitoxin system RelE/ParE family toxin [Prosthecobacter fusiformis]TDU70928.1 toxin ParE1/3/4 [Prosthecobacter fusiformis]